MENWNKIIKDMLAMYTRIVTSVMISASIYIAAFWGSTSTLEVNFVWQVLGVSLLTTIWYEILFHERKQEISKGRTLAHMIEFVIGVDAIVLLSGAVFDWFEVDNVSMIIGMQLCIAGVFVLVIGSCYIIDSSTAKKMNQKLRERENVK